MSAVVSAFKAIEVERSKQTGVELRPMTVYVWRANTLLVVPAWLVMGDGLKPLREIRERSARRAADDLTALAMSEFQQLTPMVDTINGLITRLKVKIQNEEALLADARRVELSLEDPEVALAVREPEHFALLIDKLLDNAIKHTPEGGRVQLKLAECASLWRREIIDEGAAIEQNHRERVFERFFRVQGQDFAGSGLGLAITHQAAARNRARIVLGAREDSVGLRVEVRIHR